jgi:hypothetical protein
MKRWRCFLIALLLAVTASCGDGEHNARCAALIGGGGYCIQPSTAVAPFEIQQKVEFRIRGQSETMIVELETDAAGMRFVGLTPFGQTLLRVGYDNQTTTASTLPDARLPPALLIALMQIALWPADSVRAGLEAPLRLEETAGQRRLLNGDLTTLTINYSGDQPPYRRMQIAIPAAEIELDVETLP